MIAYCFAAPLKSNNLPLQQVQSAMIPDQRQNGLQFNGLHPQRRKIYRRGEHPNLQTNVLLFWMDSLNSKQPQSYQYLKDKKKQNAQEQAQNYNQFIDKITRNRSFQVSNDIEPTRNRSRSSNQNQTIQASPITQRDRLEMSHSVHLPNQPSFQESLNKQIETFERNSKTIEVPTVSRNYVERSYSLDNRQDYSKITFDGRKQHRYQDQSERFQNRSYVQPSRNFSYMMKQLNLRSALDKNIVDIESTPPPTQSIRNSKLDTLGMFLRNR